MMALYLLLVTCGLCIISYQGVAKSNGWRMGTLYANSNAALYIFGGICFFGGTIEAFFEFKWYWVIIGFVLSWFIGMTITNILKEKTQIVAPLLATLSLISIFIIHLINAN